MRKLLFISVALVGTLILLSCGSNDSTTNYQISISASPSEGGAVSPSGGQYEEGTSLDITATPSAEFRFVEWQGDYTGTNSSATIAVDMDKNIKAIFAKKEYTLNINTDGEGTVSESIVQTTSTKDFESGTIVELSANSEEGWRFVKWEGDLTGSENPSRITIDKPKEVTAVFEEVYELTINTIGEGKVAINPKQEFYTIDTNVKLTAEAADSWRFVEWQGDITSKENPVEFIIGDNTDISAKFMKITVTDIALNTNAETIYINDELVLNATASPENAFNKNVIWKSSDPSIATVDETGKVIGVSKGSAIITSETEDGGYTDEAKIKVETYYKEIGKPYKAPDSLTVTLNSLNFTDHGNYYEYNINYTLKNNTDSIIDEGQFIMHYVDDQGTESQYGFFDKLTPGEELTRSYTWEIDDTEPLFEELEYNNVFNSYEKPLLWLVDTK